MILSISWFVLATVSFGIAVQQIPRYLRYILGCVHLGCVVNTLRAAATLSSNTLSDGWVSFVIGTAVCTTSIVFTETSTIRMTSPGLKNRLRETFWVWSNHRRLPYTFRDISTTRRDETRDRVWFGVRACSRVVTLQLVDLFVSLLVDRALRKIGLTIDDFGPAKQTLYPPLNYHDLYIRAIMSVQWIWKNYAFLRLTHELFSILFVSLLGWDLPSEWPPIFGNIAEAYSLRRFWGVFWHRLHVAAYEAYMPSFLRGTGSEQRQESGRRRNMRNSARALWIFLFSAGCHTLLDFVVIGMYTGRQEFGFFLLNYVGCLVETVATSIVGKRYPQTVVFKAYLRIIGYAWVFAFFFCTVPAWKYPLVYEVLIREHGHQR
ncbi:hypothetical protein F5Y04DRAFT_285808 [Hypomontagnella monticulosa]|nr:hypothetical protein F5Y04DRAFT_285808 [Hypomontagnella monticulosa]